jgi:uncharacterized repeat protein (TIGR03803 family)
VRIEKHARAILVAIVISVVMLGGTANARDRAYRVIYNFHGSLDGWGPFGVLAAAKNGDLYGIATAGGISNYGTVFKLMAPQTRGGAWKFTVLYDFPGGSGGERPSSLVLGADGNLYGIDFSQTIFELKRPASHHGVWKYRVLYTLNQNSDGVGIQGLVFDAAGNLYGATELGGDPSCLQRGCGTVFELQRPTKDSGQWVYSVLYTFTGQPDAAEPFAGVTFDQQGNLYGTTYAGGALDWGAVYRLGHPTEEGHPWTETVLYSFDPSNDDMIRPEGPITFDVSGSMYGTTVLGGDLNCSGGYGCGVVFDLTEAGGTWTYTNLHSFQGGNDGLVPTGYIVIDGKGSLYSTTQLGGGTSDAGIAFKLSPPVQQGDPWTETVLHSFKAPIDSGDNGGLIWGKWGDLYGVTYFGGTRGCQRKGCGTVFELQP